jgi:hypothetical protein
VSENCATEQLNTLKNQIKIHKKVKNNEQNTIFTKNNEKNVKKIKNDIDLFV